jgi:GT2 family glycosyltransferase
MIAVAGLSPEIGLVNPASNNLGQGPAKGETAEEYAAGLAPNRGKYLELGAAIGFCMLIKREVIRKAGPLDEIYGMGNFEDTDLSRRAGKEGYIAVMAPGAYVYHREHSSFRLVKAFDDDFKRNREIFEFRWGRPKRVAYFVDTRDGNTLLRLGREFLSLARAGNWVWCFSREKLALPAHANIRYLVVPGRKFYPVAFFMVFKRKKKFDEMYLGDEKVGRLAGCFSFIHNAKIGYY